MPRLAAHVYAAHQANLLKMVKMSGAVSASEVADELNVSKSVATTLIKKAGLVATGKRGRSQLFEAPSSDKATDEPESSEEKKPELPPEVEESATVDDETKVEKDIDLNEIAQIDEAIVDTRTALQDAAAKVGKAAGEWAKHQALVEALQRRLTDLAEKRMRACS